jgi:ornithine cyclodeaminase/alanine dehydrogenase-like protein (mu-crystallin family)
MLVVGGEEVHRVCAWPELVAALHAAHRGPRPLIARASIEAEVRGVAQTYFNLPAFLPGVAMGTKIATILPDNPERLAGVPEVQALYALFDGDDGSPAAVMDGTALTYRKTAADSALGSRLLGSDHARALVMVGAGGLAPYLARAHLAIRPALDRVLVWNRTPERAEAMATDLRDGGVAAASAPDLEAAVRQADVVSCSTASTAPLVMGRWLKPGAHLDLVGGFTPLMRECDDAAVLRARLFVDEAGINVDLCGDLSDPIRRGVVPRAKVEGDLYDLCAPNWALRRRPDDITLFKNGGGGTSTCSRPSSSATACCATRPPMPETFPRLFSPLTIRHRTLRNRIVFGAHTANMAEGGLPGARHLAYYRERALGGAAMIVVEPVPVHATAVLTRGNFKHSSDEVIPHFRQVTEAVKAEGAVILHQLYHVGQHADADNSFMPGWSPSGLPSFHDSDGSHRMSEAEIEEVIRGYVEAARRAKEAGFDGVELFAAYHALISRPSAATK